MNDSPAVVAERSTQGVVDAHVHVWTTDFARFPLAPGWSESQMRPPSFTPEELFRHARPAGVERIVLIQMVFYGFDNWYMLECISRHPGVFSGVALVDEHGADPAGEMRRLKLSGVRGVRIAPPRRGDAGWLEGPGMRALWAAAADEQVAMCPLVDPEDLPAVERMCRRFPQTPVVVDHCARIGGDGQFRDADIAWLCGLARHRHVYVKLSAFYFLGAKQPPYDDALPLVRRLVDAYGCQRLMWGSDSPFQVAPPHNYSAAVELIRNRLDGVSTLERQWLLSRTAESVFFG